MLVKKGAVLLITHKRVDQLRRVINSLEAAWQAEYSHFYAIYHEGNLGVREILDLVAFHELKIVTVNRDTISSSAEAISRNVYEGLSRIFSDENIDFITVIEDDIEVRQDFLDFNIQMINMYGNVQGFKGINGFSGAKYDPARDSDFALFRYGFGWGWTITSQTWTQIQDLWKSNFNSHWDALVEDTIRTGFVVMPHNSRINNIGFDQSATHTSSGGVFEEKLFSSFRGDVKAGSRNFVPSVFDLEWRSDALIYKGTDTVSGYLVQVFAKCIEFISKYSRSFPFLFIPFQKTKVILLRLSIFISRH